MVARWCMIATIGNMAIPWCVVSGLSAVMVNMSHSCVLRVVKHHLGIMHRLQAIVPTAVPRWMEVQMGKPRLLGAMKSAPTKADKFNLRYQRNQQKKVVRKKKGGSSDELEK